MNDAIATVNNNKEVMDEFSNIRNKLLEVGKEE